MYTMLNMIGKILAGRRCVFRPMASRYGHRRIVKCRTNDRVAKPYAGLKVHKSAIGRSFFLRKPDEVVAVTDGS